jgi:hypothetical protein
MNEINAAKTSKDVGTRKMQGPDRRSRLPTKLAKHAIFPISQHAKCSTMLVFSFCALEMPSIARNGLHKDCGEFRQLDQGYLNPAHLSHS